MAPEVTAAVAQSGHPWRTDIDAQTPINLSHSLQEVSLARPETLKESLLTASNFPTVPSDATRAAGTIMIMILIMVIAPISGVFLPCQALC